jgi:hypothetical protein
LACVILRFAQPWYFTIASLCLQEVFTLFSSIFSAIIGVFSLALSKYEEKQGNYSREFSEIEDEMKLVIDEVLSNGK